jgi:DNA-binding transcriptional LysR family regulator
MTTTSDNLQQRGLKLSHLRMLAALAETGQIGAAADRIGIAQPAASRLLAEVERIIGGPVHERTGRGIRLTPVGEALSRRAQRVQMELRDAARELTEVAGGASGHVRIGAVTGPALERVLPMLRAARMSHPGVTVEVTVSPSDLLCEQLLAGRLDFAIARLPDNPDRALLDFRAIAGEPVQLMTRRGHPLQYKSDLAAQDLLAFDWVMPGPDSILGRTVLARLRALGLPQPPQRLSTSSFLLTLALLQQSNAIAPLASAVADTFAKGEDAPYQMLKLDLGIEVEPYGLITGQGMALTPAAQRMADMILPPIQVEPLLLTQKI